MTNINQNKQEVVHSLLEDNGEIERLKSYNSFTNSQLQIYLLTYSGIWSENQTVVTPITYISNILFQADGWGSLNNFLAYSSICLLI